MKAGRKPYKPTPEQIKVVTAMAGYGITQEGIARVIGTTPVTLRKYYGAILEKAAIEANAQVAQSLFQMATKQQNVAAAIFWLKVRAGWVDPQRHEVSGPGGAPVMLVTGVIRGIKDETTPVRRIGTYDIEADAAD